MVVLLKGPIFFAALFSFFFWRGEVKAEQPYASTVIFEQNERSGYCYRIPSLTVLKGKFYAVAQRRHRLHGEMCSDDGNIDLVMKTSSDGRTWSAEKPIVLSSEMKPRLLQPSSIYYDASLPKNFDIKKMYLKLGEQAVGEVDGRLIVIFGASYNHVERCGVNSSDCVNSPENGKAGYSKNRFFKAISDDQGKTWTLRRIHHEVYQSCVREHVSPVDLRNALLSLFPNENYRNLEVPLFGPAVEETLDILDLKGAAKVYRAFTESRPLEYDRFWRLLAKRGVSQDKFIARYQGILMKSYNARITEISMGTGMDSKERSKKIGELLRVNPSIVEKFLPTLRVIFQENHRAGPGNAITFETAARSKALRFFVPAAPLSFYSDDRGASWTCADSVGLDNGSERQAAYLGEGRVLMTLRNIVGNNDVANHYRIFSLSKDYGKTWPRGRRPKSS